MPALRKAYRKYIIFSLITLFFGSLVIGGCLHAVSQPSSASTFAKYARQILPISRTSDTGTRYQTLTYFVLLYKERKNSFVFESALEYYTYLDTLNNANKSSGMTLEVFVHAKTKRHGPFLPLYETNTATMTARPVDAGSDSLALSAEFETKALQAVADHVRMSKPVWWNRFGPLIDRGEEGHPSLLIGNLIETMVVLIAVLILIPSLVGWWHSRQRYRRLYYLLQRQECPQCRYDLHATKSKICPECGEHLRDS